MTVDEAVALYQSGDVVVYPAVDVAEGTETWTDVEDMGSGSTVLADLRNAGATDEQIIRGRVADRTGTAEGRTLDKMFGRE